MVFSEKECHAFLPEDKKECLSDAHAPCILMKVLICTGKGFEESEVLYPYYRFKEELMTTHIASEGRGIILGAHGYPMDTDMPLQNVEPKDYDILMLPGGEAAYNLCQDVHCIAIARHFLEANKLIGAICAGPLVLAGTGLIRGRSITCSGKAKGRMMETGAKYRDDGVVVDEMLITGKGPDDLPELMRMIMHKVDLRNKASITDEMLDGISPREARRMGLTR